jgi:hypothetical protein
MLAGLAEDEGYMYNTLSENNSPRQNKDVHYTLALSTHQRCICFE